MSEPDQYAVMGHPVSRSRSPFIHGMFAKQTAQRMTYGLLDVPPEDFVMRASGFFAGGGKGLNITLPHKPAAASLAHQLAPRAARAAAVNTLVARQDGTLFGDNTDGVGLTRDLALNLGVVMLRARVLILGAGGAANGVIASLLEFGPDEIMIANRTAERAENLAARFADLGTVRGGGYETLGAQPFDVIINATSASLAGDMPAVAKGIVGDRTVCYDMAYGREPTPFQAWARSLGCRRAEMGIGMLVEQAAESFFIWRGVRPETQSVLAQLRRRLAGVA